MSRESVMDRSSDDDQKSFVWTKTKQAVAQFRDLLLCAKCSKLMSEPVCFGSCEHMFCRTCAGPHIGSGCCVCHSPAWVKDIQVNRQLNNITQLFHDLESLLNPEGLSAMPPAGSAPQPSDSALTKNKKNLKIWFSPRSRKVRCRVERASEGSPSGQGPGKALLEPSSDSPVSRDLSVYNFNSSSQDSGSSSPQHRNREGGGGRKRQAVSRKRKRPQTKPRPTTRRQTKMADKKEKLAAINERWGFGQADRGPEGEDKGRSEDRPSKKVSFQILGGVPSPLEEPQPLAPQDDDQLQTLNGTVLEAGPAREGETAAEEAMAVPTQTLSPNRSAVKPADPATPSPKRTRSSSAHLSSKTASPPEGAQPESSPKRRKPSPRRERRSGAFGGFGPHHLTASPPEGAQSVSTPKRRKLAPRRERRSGALDLACLTPPSTHSSPDVQSPVRRSPKDQGNPLGSPRTPKRGSVGGPGMPRAQPSLGSPAYLKRNHKGETPLHLAAIKGDVEVVKELLDEGADPNLKDHAGWTPLHEACNLGHVAVVEVLLQQGALLNTPGYQNDSPLHDAVRNGHTAIARLLLGHGASRDVLNTFGLRPVDYAESAEMQAILRAPSEGPQPLSTPLSPTASLSKVPSSVQRDGVQVFLGSKLTTPQKKQLSKLGCLLGLKCVDTFSSSVTHIIVPEGPMPTTLSCLRGVLNGCWVLRFSWVEACLKVQGWMPESGFEAGEGPQCSRVNRDLLLPQLFDGCFFFFLGSFRNPSREELLQLVKEGGGQVLARKPKPHSDVTQTLTAAAYHARPGTDQALCTQYILYDPQGSYRPPRVRLGKVWSAPCTWLLDCISSFQLLPVPEL